VSAAAGSVHPGKGTQAEALARALRELGFSAAVLKSRGHGRNPCVVADSGSARQVRSAGLVYAAPDDDGGEWWFWLADRRAPVDVTRVATLSEVSQAASAVDLALTCSCTVFSVAG
jgi:molybdopterin-guanine dinucleotide biosynthesis protein